MNSLSRVSLISLIAGLLGAIAHADDVSSSLEQLGGNKQLIRRAKALDPKNKVQVVQNRSVDRDLRLELGVSYAGIAGGDPYVRTDQLGANLDFHLTPRWSVGFRYSSASNDLSSEGKRVIEDARIARAGGLPQERPEIDFVSDTYMGVINFYPMYGKINMFDLGIAQFDIYLLAGGGQVKLTTGSSDTWTGGGGVGFWWSQHFSTRFEVRYQTYEDQLDRDPRRLDLTVFSASFGFLL